MARRSPHEHLKPQIVAEFEKGKVPVDVYGIFPGVPRATIRDWFLPFRQDSATIPPRSSDRPKNQPQQAIADSASPQGKVLHLVPDADINDDLDDDNLSDIAWAKREIKKHVRRPNRDSAVVVQALNAFLRAIQIERSLPADEPDDPELQSARTARIAQLLDQGRDRRDRSSSQVEQSG